MSSYEWNRPLQGKFRKERLFALILVLLRLIPPAFPGSNGVGKIVRGGACLWPEGFAAEAFERGMSRSPDNRLAVLQHRNQVGNVILIVLHSAGEAGRSTNLRVIVLEFLAQRGGGDARE